MILKKLRAMVGVTFLFGLFLLCCTPTQVSQQVSQPVVASQGAEIRSSDGQVQLSIPKNSLEKDTTITLKVTDKTSETLSPVYEFGPDGTQFKQPATIAVKWENNDPSVTLAVYSGGQWVPLPNVRYESGQLLGDVAHFSSITVTSNKNAPTACNPACASDQVCKDGKCVAQTGFCDLSASSIAGTYSLFIKGTGGHINNFILVILKDGTVTFSETNKNVDYSCRTDNTKLCSFKMDCVQNSQAGIGDFKVELTRESTTPSTQNDFCSTQAGDLIGRFVLKVNGQRVGQNEIVLTIDKDGNTTQTGRYMVNGNWQELYPVECKIKNANLCSYEMDCKNTRGIETPAVIRFKKE